MKSIKSIKFIVLIICLSVQLPMAWSQGLTDEKLEQTSIPGTRWEVMGGINIGAFDCNQTVKYPFSFGSILAVQYTPQIKYPAFLGMSAGGFVVKGEEAPEHWGRKVNMSMFDIFMYAGYRFDLSSGDEETGKYGLKVALGLPYVDFLQIKSTGPGYQKPTGGIGAGALFMLDLPKRLSLFGTVYRMGKDLDGFGYTEQGDVLEGNTKAASYIYKWGILWRFFK